MTPSRFAHCLLIACASALAPATPLVHAAPADTARAAAWFDAHTSRSTLLRQFLQRMPKGADLHSHLTGAVYAEDYLAWAAEDEACVDLQTLRFGKGCGTDGPSVPMRNLSASGHAATYGALVDRMSTRDLATAGRSGHDQFFDAFSHFPPDMYGAPRVAAMAAELRDRAAADHVLHLELMSTLQRDAVVKLADKLPWAQETDLARRWQWLRDQGLDSIVEAARHDLDALDAEQAQQLRCGTPAARPGCEVSLRWLQQSTRTSTPERVFAQLAFATALSSADPRVAGINLVAPEDHEVALRDYALQMQMVGFLAQRHPKAGIALHAGELALGLVPPEHLRSHIRDAVLVAGARRIGHAVDIAHEDGALQTLATMRQRRVAVEVCLTSNDTILGVKGRDHPLPDYLAAGVPVVLASDDAGISRIDLSNEYLRAAREHGLRYPQLKQLSRNSLEYSFLPGASLWQDAGRARAVDACRRDVPTGRPLSTGCKDYLAGSEKAARQWALEAAFDAFEALPEWRGEGR